MEELQQKQTSLHNSIEAIAQAMKSLSEMDKQLKQELRALETRIRRKKYNL